MAFTRLLRSARAAAKALEESIKLESELDQTSIPFSRSAREYRPFLSDQQVRLDAEAQARREVSRTLAGADWHRASTFLEGLIPEYEDTGRHILIGSGRLFFALIEYFREYSVEFDVEVSPNSGKRTLKRALTQLVAIIPNTCFQEQRPDFSGQNLVATSQSEKAVLLAVKNFLILKAKEIAPGVEASSLPKTRTGYVWVESTPESVNDLNPGSSQASTYQLSPQSQRTLTQTIPQSTTVKPTSTSGASKRKRSESRTNIFTNILENARNLESLCREQEEEINKLKAQVSNRELRVGESDKLERKVQTGEKEARDWEAEAKRLERDNVALTNKCGAEATRRRRLQHEAQSLQQERDSVEQAWKFEIARKQAMKEMLMVNGGFKAGSIETAAKAISEGKRPRDAIADIYRSGGAGALD